MDRTVSGAPRAVPPDPTQYRRCAVCDEPGAGIPATMTVSAYGNVEIQYVHHSCAAVAEATS